MNSRIDITEFFENDNPHNYSGSVATHGKDAARILWAASKAKGATTNFLDTQEKWLNFCNMANDAGFSEDFTNWTKADVEALFVQWVSNDMRESGLHSGMDDDEWREYEKGAAEGCYASNIFRGDDDRVYFSLE